MRRDTRQVFAAKIYESALVKARQVLLRAQAVLVTWPRLVAERRPLQRERHRHFVLVGSIQHFGR